MSEINKYEAYKKKMQGICDENNLIFRFKNDKYPMTLTIMPVGELDVQLSMLENAEDSGYTSPDASIVFTFKDGVLVYKMSQFFSIGDALFSKIKNLFKNMHYTWLQYFFRDVIERQLISAQYLLSVCDAEGDDLPYDAEPLEDYEEIDAAEDIDLIDEDDAEDAHGAADEVLIAEATRIVRHENKAAVSLLQKGLKLGYAKASRLLDELEALGVIGPYNGSGPREVLPYDAPADDMEAADDAAEA